MDIWKHSVHSKMAAQTCSSRHIAELVVSALRTLVRGQVPNAVDPFVDLASRELPGVVLAFLPFTLTHPGLLLGLWILGPFPGLPGCILL